MKLRLITYASSMLFIIAGISALLIFQTATKKKDFSANSSNETETTFLSDSQQVRINSFRETFIDFTSKKVDIDSAEKVIATYPENSLERKMLEAAICGLQTHYDRMFEKLYSGFRSDIPYLEYYDLLLLSATESGNYEQLTKFMQERLNGSKSTGANYLKGIVFQLNSNFDSASTIYGKLLGGTTNPKLILRFANSLMNTGHADSATVILNKYEKQLSHEYDKIEVLLLKGAISFYESNLKQSEEYYSKSLKLAQASGYQNLTSHALINMGIILDEKGNLDEARSSFKQASVAAKSINYHTGVALAAGELGVSYSFSNEKTYVLSCYKTAVEELQFVKNSYRLSLIYANLGNAYLTIGDYLSAKSSFEKGLSFSKNTPRSFCLNSIGLGDVYSNSGNLSKALEYYESAKHFIGSAKLNDLKPKLNISVTALSYNVGKYNMAKQLCEEILDNTGEIPVGPNDVCQLYRHLGIIYYGMDSLETASKYLSDAEAIAKQYSLKVDLTRIILEEATLLIEKKNYSTASAFLDKAYSQYSNMNESEKLNYFTSRLKIANETKNFAESKRLIALANEIQYRCISPENNSDYFLEAAKYYTSINDIASAKEKYFKAISIVENISSTLLANQKLHISRRASVFSVYEQAVQFFLSQKDFNSAFTVLDLAKAKNTSTAISEKTLHSLSCSKSDFEELNQLAWVVENGRSSKFANDVFAVYYSNLLDSLNGKMNNEDAELEKNPAKYIAKLQSGIGEQTYIVSTYSIADKSWFFILSKKSLKTVEVAVGKDEIKSLMAKVSQKYGKNSLKELQINSDLFAFNAAQSNELYNTVFAKVFSSIPENSKVVFIPSKELYAFPLDMLVKTFDKSQSPYKYDNVDFLVNHYSISTSPSAQIYNKLMSEKKNTDIASTLIIGDPSFPKSISGVYAERRGFFDENPGTPRNISLYPLKYSGDEISSIERKFQNTNVFSKKEATETNFKLLAQSSGIIHLSTHSFLIGKQPAIFFSPEYDKSNDGILEASEVSEMNINADLVALSSCNSGEGVFESSEGIVGMTKAFLDAGAGSVVVSMWEVNDRYTTEFMKLFYSALKSGASKTDALRLAKSQFIKTISPNPYYWSGFVLVGNTNALPDNYLVNTTNKYLPIALIGLLLLSIFIYKARHSKQTLNNR